MTTTRDTRQAGGTGPGQNGGRPAATGAGRGPSARYRGPLVSRFGLVAFAILLIVLFSALLPNTFPTVLDFRSIVSGKSVDAVLALAAMLPVATGKYDISLGYGVALGEVLASVLIIEDKMAWPLVIVIVLGVGAVTGIINGLLVEFAQIDSFIATLGTGSVLDAIMLWVSGGNEIVGKVPNDFLQLDRLVVGPIPIPIFYIVGIAVVIWLLLEYLPVGRYLYAVGANPRAASLNGISSRRYVIGTFVGCGVLTGFGGILLAAQLGSGQPSIGNSYLLPALVGALLGSTALQPGRANAWGTIVAVVTLAVGISGLEQLGAHFFIDPLFNGFTLLIAVGIAGFATRNRRQARIGLARRGGGGGGTVATDGDADPPSPLNGSGALSSGALPSSAPSSGSPPPSGAPPGAATT